MQQAVPHSFHATERPCRWAAQARLSRSSKHAWHSHHGTWNKEAPPNLNSSKATGPPGTGPDAIPAKFPKECTVELVPIITHLFQQSLDEGQAPDDWKSQNVHPVFKKGSKSDPAIYRPVALTAILKKTGALCVIAPPLPPGQPSLDQILSTWIQEEVLNHHPATDSRHRPFSCHGRGLPDRLHHPWLQQGLRQGRPRALADITGTRGRRQQPPPLDEIIPRRPNIESLHRPRRIQFMQCHIWCARGWFPRSSPFHHLH